MYDGDAVGYGNPPKHTQFKKGQSGNPKGRPSGARNRNAPAVSLKKVFDRMIRDTKEDKYISIAEALFRLLKQNATKGDMKALVRVERLRDIIDQKNAEDAVERAELKRSSDKLYSMLNLNRDEET